MAPFTRITEQDSNYRQLQDMSVMDVLTNINKEDQTVPVAVAAAINDIEKVVSVAIEKMLQGGRLFYMGAGTSGRLGVVDASEIPPTFGVAHGIVIGIIAGGDTAIRKAVEFAEDDTLKAWKDLLLNHAFEVQPLLCIVPRHPERFTEVADQIHAAGLKFRRRTEWQGIPKDTTDLDVVLGDSMGEMPMYYSAADLVVMGGSLLRFGGQNLIEACAAGCPVLLGEHTYNFQQASIDAIDAGAAKRIKGDLLLGEPIALMEALKSLLLNPAELAQMAVAAKTYSVEHQGATKRIIAALDHQNFTLA